MPEDAAAIARIYIDSWNAGFGDLMPKRALDAETVRRWRADLAAPLPHRWWTATRDGAVVGFAGIGPSRDPIDSTLGELDTIAVDPKHWRTGVGRALMARALHHLAADGYREAIVWTLASYPRGSGFYESTGWRPSGLLRDGGRQVRYGHPLTGEGSPTD
jgi:GNAT superfamily N-acetyltransferase